MFKSELLHWLEAFKYLIQSCSVPPVIQKVYMCHSLYCWGHELHVGVHDALRVHVCQLDGLPDLLLLYIMYYYTEIEKNTPVSKLLWFL